MPTPLYVRLFGTALAVLLLIPRAGNSMGEDSIAENPAVETAVVSSTTELEPTSAAICAREDDVEEIFDSLTGTCEVCGDTDTSEEELQRGFDELMAAAPLGGGDPLAATPVTDEATVN